MCYFSVLWSAIFLQLLSRGENLLSAFYSDRQSIYHREDVLWYTGKSDGNKSKIDKIHHYLRDEFQNYYSLDFAYFFACRKIQNKNQINLNVAEMLKIVHRN